MPFSTFGIIHVSIIAPRDKDVHCKCIVFGSRFVEQALHNFDRQPGCEVRFEGDQRALCSDEYSAALLVNTAKTSNYYGIG